MRKTITGILFVAVSVAAWLSPNSGLARESWPIPGAAIQQRDAEWSAYEQQVISNDAPVIAEWANEGKPFIPWASQPGDLPQAKVPAFPGAEGGGMYSFGGRGGKVYVVTNLNNSETMQISAKNKTEWIFISSPF